MKPPLSDGVIKLLADQAMRPPGRPAQAVIRCMVRLIEAEHVMPSTLSDQVIDALLTEAVRGGLRGHALTRTFVRLVEAGLYRMARHNARQRQDDLELA